ncbi:MAG: trehalose-phosphatase [Gemmatimonadetes bacterium]|nr:trehalose-phosphatase [Gemmatimonadota bacterium]
MSAPEPDRGGPIETSELAIPHARELLPGLLALRRRAGRMLVALDFDGTLSPIVPRPEDAALLDGVDAPLRRLADRDDTIVAIVSGRGLRDVHARVRLDGVYYAGNHGFEIEGPDLDRVHEAARAARPALEEAAGQIARALEDEPGTQVEDKGWTLSIHYRRAERAGAEERVREAVRRHGRAGGLRVTEGKKILEIRPDVDWHKGAAMRFLLDTLTGDGELPAIFIGDDRTDEDAFAVVAELGGGIVVGDPPPADTRARAWLSDPDEVAALIEELAHDD